ncbi:haloacid dehalogenase-like hydrolase [Sulfurimonas sp. SAG-AH-194-C21]|nr:HAD family hydrolase [Sulfurimonas sp. SAG-AH-194-C21]MDF1884244.1 haloacid dehalogenase-like hydrolase [Sulfurimonas sp. SAG-AH-194-C21]
MTLALFDFDGTLTTKDSLGEFIKFAVGKPTYYFKLALFSPIFFLYKTKLMDNSYAKELLFRLYFYKINEDEFKKKAQKYGETKINDILRQNIYEKFLQHIKNGDKVLLVSASMRCWLSPWAQKHKVELLCTELAFENKTFTGHFKTKNCHGEEKLTRVQAHLNLDDYDKIYTYGDSSGDDAILGVADVKVRVK